MRNPGKDPRRQHVGPPSDTVPTGILVDPALHQIACCFARAGACRGNIGNPSEAVPCGEPFLPRRGRRPARRRGADELAGELDLTGGNRCAALGVTRPALRDSESEVGGNPPDQGMPIERTGGERLEGVPTQPSQQPGKIGTKVRGRQSVVYPFRFRWRRPSSGRPALCSLGRPAEGRSQKACRRGNPMWFRNKESHPPASRRACTHLDPTAIPDTPCSLGC